MMLQQMNCLTSFCGIYDKFQKAMELLEYCACLTVCYLLMRPTLIWDSGGNGFCTALTLTEYDRLDNDGRATADYDNVCVSVAAAVLYSAGPAAV